MTVTEALAASAGWPRPSSTAGPLPGEQIARWVAWALERPWLLAVPVALTLLITAAVVLTRRALNARAAQDLTRQAHQVWITPPPEVDPSGAALWWAMVGGLLAPTRRRGLHRERAHVALEYRWSGRHLQIVVWVPGTVPAESVASLARAAWPGAGTAITEADAPVPVPAPDPAHTGDPDPGGPDATRPAPATIHEAGGVLRLSKPAWYPLRDEHDIDPLRALVAAVGGLQTGEHACVQVLARPATARQSARLDAGAAALKTGAAPGGPLSPERLLRAGLDLASGVFSSPAGSAHSSAGPGGRAGPRMSDPLRERDARGGLDKSAGPQWEVAVRFAVTGAQTRRGADMARSGAQRQAQGVVAHRLKTLSAGLGAAFAVYAARNRLRARPVAHPAAFLAARALHQGFLLSQAELSSLAGLPTDLSVAGLDRARARSVAAPITVPPGGRGTKVLGRAQAGGHRVALPVADARQHVHVLGATGSGKSTLLTHLILADVAAGRGVVLIDPKGDLADDVLDRLPAGAAERLVLIDPDQPVGSAMFNPLQLRPGADPDLIVDNIVSIFAAIFQRHWGPRIDDVLRVACLTVMRHRNPTLVTVPPLLNDKQFRAPFTVGLDDPEGLKGFWEWFETTPANLRAQVIGPVLARLRSFLLRDFVRDTIGSPISSFDMGQVLDRGGILIARLPKGQLGEDTARLLGSLVFASVWQAATARSRMPQSRRADASVYIDEAHNILNLAGSVDDMLAEARGYRLSLVLAHQHLAQLPRETQLALSANARNKIFFNCSPEDARQLARHTLPELDEHDLSHLDAYIAATRLVIDNRETAAFTLRTDPPRPATAGRDQLRAQIAARPPARTGEASEPEPEPEPAATVPQPPERSDGPPPVEPTGRWQPPGPLARTAARGHDRTPRTAMPSPGPTPDRRRFDAIDPTTEEPQVGGRT